MNGPGQKIYVKENYLFLLEKLGLSSKQMLEQIDFSESTERRIRNGDVSTISDTIIEELVRFYNAHGPDLYPHHVDLSDFKYRNLSECTAPLWINQQVAGDYIGLYLSRRGTGKAKAMILRITETEHYTLEARAIDTVHRPEQAMSLIDEILSEQDLTKARELHKAKIKSKYSLLRGSHFLHGTVSGRGDLLLIHLKDEHGTYEMTLATSLKSYLKVYDEVENKYALRGGAAMATVYDIDSWPYSMVIGLCRDQCWHPELVNMNDIVDALQRIHGYQQKQNMLCLQSDIDSLFYESIMYAHHRSREED